MYWRQGANPELQVLHEQTDPQDPGGRMPLVHPYTTIKIK
jgi:hypothetical protein